MSQKIGISEVGMFLAGVLTAGFLAGRRNTTALDSAAPRPSGDWQRAVNELDRRMAEQEAANATRFAQVETKLQEQAARLAELPSTQQIVGAMEQLIAKTMASLDERLASQAHSIEVLKTTVSQTDSLLERVLESLDSLQAYAEPLELGEDSYKQAV